MDLATVTAQRLKRLRLLFFWGPFEAIRRDDAIEDGRRWRRRHEVECSNNSKRHFSASCLSSSYSLRQSAFHTQFLHACNNNNNNGKNNFSNNNKSRRASRVKCFSGIKLWQLRPSPQNNNGTHKYTNTGILAHTHIHLHTHTECCHLLMYLLCLATCFELFFVMFNASLELWLQFGPDQDNNKRATLHGHTHTHTHTSVYPVLHVDNSRGRSSSRTAHKVGSLLRAGYMWYTTFHGAQLYWAIEYLQREGKRGIQMETKEVSKPNAFFN